MAFFKKSNSDSAEKYSAKNNRRNEKSYTVANGSERNRSYGFNFGRFIQSSRCIGILVVAIYMLLLNISPLDNRVMSQIQRRNLSENNGNGSFRGGNSGNNNVPSVDSNSEDDIFGGFGDIDLNDDVFPVDQNTEESDKEASGLSNELPKINELEMIFSTDLTREELNDMVNSLDDLPSKNDIINIWKHAYAIEGQDFYELISSLYKYFGELKEKYQVDNKCAVDQWGNVISIFYHILSEREENYIKKFYELILKDSITKTEFVDFFNVCTKEAKELRETLHDMGKNELDAEMIPKN
ncbi:Plasmodium exported protein, unknown function [Plasmodium gonderi]|uniref:Plasmodium RESA N-terminal domain-containing protein n=1 Tax=Plasmodium gonderi TaxID=77519 RepID=A0A1Y1JNR9_PLAGO|nr:Plasmodium exported protein, unknown function [Plasmodium gonderi]GAW82043.1 Plasmodium exported protein, unknown function [Plasmodium gonderi]